MHPTGQKRPIYINPGAISIWVTTNYECQHVILAHLCPFKHKEDKNSELVHLSWTYLFTSHHMTQKSAQTEQMTSWITSPESSVFYLNLFSSTVVHLVFPSKMSIWMVNNISWRACLMWGTRLYSILFFIASQVTSVNWLLLWQKLRLWIKDWQPSCPWVMLWLDKSHEITMYLFKLHLRTTDFIS